MSKITKAAYSRNQLSYQEFAVKHQSELADVHDIIGSPNRTFTLAQASAAKRSEGISFVLDKILRHSVGGLNSATF